MPNTNLLCAATGIGCAVIGMLVVNCLSPLQIAHTFVAAWPYYPAVSGGTAAVARNQFIHVSTLPLSTATASSTLVPG